jgi:hypothetical protein
MYITSINLTSDVFTMTSKRYDIYVSELEKHGCKVLGFRQGKHRIAKCVSPNGTNFSIPLAFSPSDWRSFKNFQKQVKRYSAEEQ